MPDDVQSLAQLLASDDPSARLSAAEQLSTRGEDAAEVAVALIKALGDEDESVRQLIGSALEDCGPPRRDAIEELEQLLSNSNADIAYWAATLLGRLEAGAIQAVESLRTAAAEHPSQEVRKRATWALGKIATG